jgi:3-hydroxypropanoate dehydrogenase
MRRIVSDTALDVLFRAAGDRHTWRARPVGDTILRAVWELVRLGPTSGECGPVRLAFVRSEVEKARLAPALPEAERSELMTAPVVAVVGCPADGDDDATLRDGALHAACLIFAARALGLDCAPIWRFDRGRAAALFRDETAAVTFLCGLGYGEEVQAASGEPPRPRFDEACSIL